MTANPRTIARVVNAVHDAQSHITRASGAVRAATDSPVGGVVAALDAAQTELLAAWEALAYITAELEEDRD